MEFIELINNRNLKKLLKKKYLTEELVREIKTSFFIHPSTSQGDDLYSFNHSSHRGCKVIELFTSMDEYNRVYGNNDEYVPTFWHFNAFENSFDDDTRGILINPAGEKFFITDWVCFLIMDDMDDAERTIMQNTRKVEADDLKELKSEIDYLDRYLSGKTKITYIKRLFDILGSSVVYVLYESEESLDGHFKNGMISNEDASLRYLKKDNHIMVFTDRNNFGDVTDSRYHYYYGIADLIYVIQTVFELDYNGLILKTPENEFVLARHRLLKYWDDIVENYRSVDTASEYAFKIGGDADEGL